MAQQVEVKVRLYGRFRRCRLWEVDFDSQTVTVQLLSWEMPNDREVDPFHYDVSFRSLRAEDLKCLVKLQRGEMKSYELFYK